MIWSSQPQDCLEDVLKLLLEFLLRSEEGVLLGFTHWCFRNVGRGAHVEVVKGLYNYVRVRVAKGMQIQNFEMNFRPRFDACISFNVQPIDMKLKTLVFLDFNDHLCSFLGWGCRIGIVLSHHLDRSKGKVQRCQDLVMSQYRLFLCRCELLCK